MLVHIAAFTGFIIPVPGVNYIAPLIIWLLKKEEMPFVDDQGKQAMNFQLTVLIVALVCFALTLVVIGIPMLIALGIYTFVMIVIAAIKANDGIAYRYPFTIQFFK
jgi:uncharacterized Tic20 family protein